MVQASQQRKFDGVRPDDLVFGKTLGEGRFLELLIHHL